MSNICEKPVMFRMLITSRETFTSFMGLLLFLRRDKKTRRPILEIYSSFPQSKTITSSEFSASTDATESLKLYAFDASIRPESVKVRVSGLRRKSTVRFPIVLAHYEFNTITTHADRHFIGQVRDDGLLELVPSIRVLPGLNVFLVLLH